MISINCVYGDSNVEHVKTCLVPSILSSTNSEAKFVCANFKGIKGNLVGSYKFDRVTVVDISETLMDGCKGFAANHNRIFREHPTDDFFFIINPDCVLGANAVDNLIALKLQRPRAGIIEGRQWPFEHPKEYNNITLETPWASGAFCLIDSHFYKLVGGMAEEYFLYLEDVDLSWQCWLHDYEVLYAPNAFVTHFTGGRFYRDDIVSKEEYFSLRNFMILSSKFFGKAGERRAMALLENYKDQSIAKVAVTDYLRLKAKLDLVQSIAKSHEKIKILGLNCFHEMRLS